MEILIASAHIIGSIVGLLVLSFIILLIGGWESKKIQKNVSEEMSINLGVSVADLDNEEHLPKVLKLYSEKFSNDLFVNRISDFCGFIRTIFYWLSNIVITIFLGFVVWYTFTENNENAIYAWFVIGISFFTWFVSYIFSLICKLISGRYPGQAKATRKFTAEWIQNNNN